MPRLLPPLLLLLLPLLRMPPLAAARVLHADPSNEPLNRTDRVVGGTVVTQGSVKWVASLQFRSSNMHFCGATVLNDYWVLTAAHCMVSTEKDTFQVVTGGTDLDGVGLQVRLPDKVIVADYDNIEKSNDLALIKTVEPLQPSTRVSGDFIQLSEGRPAAGTSCMVLGWGTTSSGGTTVRRLQNALVATKTNEECQQAYRNMGYTISATMLCAGGGERDACQGDSGGPLVCRADGRSASASAAGELRLAGAVSWGVRCATPGMPGVYADVGRMLAWVRATMGEE